MLNLKEIGNRIKKYRKQKGFTQAQLAEIIDISTIHMSHLETGSVAMSLECMIKVCNALEVSPDDLLIGEFELNNNATIKTACRNNQKSFFGRKQTADRFCTFA